MGMVWVEICIEQIVHLWSSSLSSFVVTNIPQVTHPLAPLGCGGTLHPQRLDSTVVEMIRHTGELLTTGRAFGGSSNTFLTEQVATTGLNRFQHNLKADRTLQSLQVLLCLFLKQVLLAFVRERELQGGSHFVGVPGRQTIPLVMTNVNIQASPPNNK